MALYTDRSPVGRYALSGNKFIDGLLPGAIASRVAWSTIDGGVTQVSYSFPWADGVASPFPQKYGLGENVASIKGAVTSAQAEQIAKAFDAWAGVAKVAFTKIAETSDGTVGDIRIAFTSAVPSRYWGYALGVSDGLSNAHGDIWIDDSIIGQSFETGTYNFMSMMHEIGHALGLKHPFEGAKIPSGFDNRRYTIMSYTDPDKVWWRNPDTGAMTYLIKSPMVYDILAIQKIYGANTAWHTGDDVYAFSPKAPSFEAIWDAGGNDTFSVADFSQGCTIDLTAGTYSSLAYDSVSLTSNIGIAFNCTIENARGGQGGDTLIGSEGSNTLSGNAGADALRGNGGNDTLDGGAGDDVLDGGLGDDTLIGGDGVDTATYANTKGAVKVSLDITGLQVTGAGNDSLSGIENLIGGTGADLLVGNAVANRLDGGAMGQVMRFDVARRARDDSHVPSRLSSIERLDPTDVVVTRDFKLSLGARGQGHGSHGSSGGSTGSGSSGGGRDGSGGGNLAMWTVNDQPYRPGVDIARPRLGTLERWRFTTDVHHPVHAHLVGFQVEQDGAPVWKDTIDVGPTSRAEVLVPIEGYRGRYVLHCHNLEHEDRMMMADFSVVGGPLQTRRRIRPAHPIVLPPIWPASRPGSRRPPRPTCSPTPR